VKHDEAPIPDPGTLEGLVVRKSSRDVLVDTGGTTIQCTFRGRLRERDADRTVLVGDRVLISALGGGEGILEQVLPRRSELVRETAGRARVVVAANVDQVLALVAARDPPPRWALVDRMLVAAERDGLVPALGLNKSDQLESDAEKRREIESILELYRSLGYPVFQLSASRAEGFEALVDWLRGKATVLSGHSGVGKSTLLNALCPGIALETGGLNEVTGKGRHTTTQVSLFRLPAGGYVADTPGFREFVPTELQPAELGRHYPEFRKVLEAGRCRYNDCLHTREPACAILRALEAGAVSKLRYESYLQILKTLGRDR